MEKPKIIVMCGSSKFCDVIAVCAWLIERDEQAITTGLHLMPYWYPASKDHLAETEGSAEAFDRLHLRKIDLADEIFVVNVNGYIGDSVKMEIEYAQNRDLPIRWYMNDSIGDEANRILVEFINKEKVKSPFEELQGLIERRLEDYKKLCTTDRCGVSGMVFANQYQECAEILQHIKNFKKKDIVLEAQYHAPEWTAAPKTGQKVCRCILAPMGDHGMEDFVLDDYYKWDSYYEDEENKKKRKYVVFLTDDGYKYEMGKVRFTKYFKKAETV